MNKAFYSSSARSMSDEMLQLTLDDIPTENPSIQRGNVTITVLKYEEIAKRGLTETAKKLLDYVLSIFTAQNSATQTERHKRVIFNIKDYAELVGYDISTTNRLDNFRKQVNADLETLYRYSVKYKDKRFGNVDFRFCQSKGLATGNGMAGTYFFDLSDIFANILITGNLVNQQPRRLFLAGKCKMSYPLGKYLALHYNMDKNRNEGRHNIISVKSILDNFSDYKSLKADANHSDRPRETLEKALEELIDCGALLYWEWCGEKIGDGKRKQIDPPKTYQELQSAYIHYELADAPDTSERRAKNAAAKQAAAAKPKRKSSKNGAKSGTRKRTAKKDADQADDQTTE